ncbi:UNC-like C-terminal-domain-containing protein [Coprinopsis sp. MPI-PUGE-AT-0042]|nr:UNC-like C-terminal-domain-containing protein [Coprinopsis sp. MPI-PUGE-AT-0042]
MLNLRRLPLALVASCILASATLAESISSPHDPFRAIALLVPKKPEPPICCLKPQSNQLETPDEELLSFEEWKVKKLHAQALPSDTRHVDPDNSSNSAITLNPDGSAHDISAGHQEGVISTYEDLTSGSPPESILPQLQVPTIGRYNYANLDCSARVHTSHRSAKSSSSILSSKKDRYMLSPCKTKEKQFVVVELCDDIRIDTVQLANYEFFSGVFKDFSISVAKTNTDAEVWTHAGTYRAKNVRGVQSFRFPDALRDFYRYIRIDFHSHYSNEYYCPLSLLRVYGLTHLEEWKWDTWVAAESRAKQAEALKFKHLAIPSTPSEANFSDIPPKPPSSEVNTSNIHPDTTSISISLSVHKGVPTKSVTQDLSSSLVQTSVDIAHESTLAPTPSNHPEPEVSIIQQLVTHLSETSPSQAPGSSHSVHISVGSSTPSIVPPLPVASSLTVVAQPKPPSSNGVHADGIPAPPRSSSSQGPPVIIIPPSATAAIPSVSTGLPISSGGESVYKVIMNKVASLETNYTLYTLYMEQQNSAIRELIKRLGEDIGRLEAVTRAQRTHSQKMLVEWEKQRLQTLVDYAQLASRVEHLSEEILLEKRLGVAQLCLMLAVLVFMGLTRGSRGESVVITGQNSMREWGRRHLSLSGDWTTRFRRKSSVSRPSGRSRAPTKPTTPPKSEIPLPADGKVEFPKRKKDPLAPIHLNNLTPHTVARVKKLSGTRARTPSLRSNGKRVQQTPNNRPATPTPLRSELRPQLLQRSSSYGPQLSVDRTTKSVKKWARTAHLHPVKSPSALQTGTDHEGQFPSGETDLGDVFSGSSSPTNFFAFPRGTKDRKRSSGRLTGRTTPDEDAENNWIDTDIGSELDLQDLEH